MKMINRHPFRWLSEPSQKSVFWFLFVFTIVLLVSMQVLGAPLNTEAAPAGIVTFEFARTLTAAQVIMDSWGGEGQVYAGLNLGLDYLFMAAYGLAIGLGCVLVARGLAERVKFLTPVGVVLAWGSLLAALLDALENYALIRVLLGSTNELWPVVAYWCAVPKFIIVAIGLLYIILGAVIAGFVRKRK
jgi:hypothetical protein